MYKKLFNGSTTTNRHRHAWVVPQDQVYEFMTKDIDYDKLIEECLKRYAVAAIDQSKEKRDNKRNR